MTVVGFEVTFPVLLLGVLTGMTYGLLAVGLVLIFRSNRIINFAHGEIGALGAALFALAVVRYHVPYWVALPFALALSGSVGALTEVAVIRRLRNAPALMSVIATLGAGQFLLLFSFAINAGTGSGSLFPQPPGFPEFMVDPLLVTQAYSGMLIMAPLVVAGLVAFLRFSRFGLAVRAAAANPPAARTAGIFVGRMSSLSWGIAGALSAFTAILIFPTRGVVTVQALGPDLLLRALAPAVIARMSSLPVALAAGVGIGVIEALLRWNSSQAGLVEVALFVVIVGALLLQRPTGGRQEDKGSWAAVAVWPPLPTALRQVWVIRNLGKIFAAASLFVALLLGLLASNSANVALTTILAFSVVGLSLGVITGLGGQLSLGQFALAGVGAVASYQVVHATGNFLLGFLIAGLVAAAVSAVIAVPALRIRGLMLAVTTLSFALVAQTWLFQQSWMLGSSVRPGQPIFGAFAFDTGRRYFLFSLVPFLLAFWIARNVWRSGLGRRLRAIRDNEEGARAFTVPVVRVKIEAFALSGFLAGLGGAIYGHTFSALSNSAFGVDASVNSVALTVLGGIGVLAGPLLGALYIIGVPQFLPLDSAALAASSLGWLLLILYFPGGLAQIVAPLRARLLRWLAVRAGVDPSAAWTLPAEESPAVPTARLVSARSPQTGAAAAEGDDEVILAVDGLTKSFGGVQAVQGVTFEVTAGETLGLIGPNGAGKTTLFELISGFTRPDTGTVAFRGTDVSRLSPEARGRLGIIRSFQDAALFPTLTVEESLQLSYERAAPTRFFRSVIGLSSADRDKASGARDMAHLMGLELYFDKRITELSTGTRRIVELACLMVLEPALLLLDEPSSGIAQRESEALGELLGSVKEHLSATLIVIEHDIPLITSLSDRMLALAAGQILADGSPAEVRADPQVIESYLGGDATAIERSGLPLTRPAEPVQQCLALTRSGARCSRRAREGGDRCVQHSMQIAAR